MRTDNRKKVDKLRRTVDTAITTMVCVARSELWCCGGGVIGDGNEVGGERAVM